MEIGRLGRVHNIVSDVELEAISLDGSEKYILKASKEYILEIKEDMKKTKNWIIISFDEESLVVHEKSKVVLK